MQKMHVETVYSSMDYTFAVLLENIFEFISEYINKYTYLK